MDAGQSGNAAHSEQFGAGCHCLGIGVITLVIQGQLQDGWTTLCIKGEREQDLANVLGATLNRLDFEVRVAGDGEEPARLDEYDWEED